MEPEEEYRGVVEEDDDLYRAIVDEDDEEETIEKIDQGFTWGDHSS